MPVILLDEDLDKRAKYRLETDAILLQGYVELLPDFSESEVRDSLVKVFRKKFALISKNDFKFVKREKNVVTDPITDDQFKWNFDAVKALMGQGKLCCRLIMPVSVLIKDEVAVDIDTEETNSDIENIFSDDMQPSCSSSSSNIVSLNSSERVQELETLVHQLLDNQENKSVPDAVSLQQALELLKSHLKNSDVEKLKVDQEDALSDCLAYYKKSDFDATLPLKIRYRGQPAVDTGGVLRQFYTDIFQQMLSGIDGMPALFEGNENRKLPIYNTGVAISGVMVLVGKIIAHAIVQVNVGPAFLAAPVYTYICTGNFSAVVSMINLDDVTSKVKHYVNQVHILLLFLYILCAYSIYTGFLL